MLKKLFIGIICILAIISMCGCSAKDLFTERYKTTTTVTTEIGGKSKTTTYVSEGHVDSEGDIIEEHKYKVIK